MMDSEQLQLSKLPCPVTEHWSEDALSHIDGAVIERLYAFCEDGTLWMCERYRLHRGGYGEYWDWDQYVLPVTEDVSLTDLLLPLIPPMVDLGNSFQVLNEQMVSLIAAAVAVPPWIWKGFSTRREMVEDRLGYKLPDWVWRVEETMRRTEGSGNGRILHD